MRALSKIRLLALCALLAIAATDAGARAETIKIVAAENFYGDVAQQIGGADVTVTSILSNPDQDPHLFEVSPSVGRNVSAARIVIYTGIDYDPWMGKLLQAARSTDRQVIIVADLIGKRVGDNPHVWYDPATILALAKALTATLTAQDPAHKSDYEQRLAGFEASVKPIQRKIEELRGKYNGLEVTATEPVFGYMFDALGMQVRNPAFQLAVMNNTEPSASDVAAFESDLTTHRVKLLVYNSQATDPIAQHLRALAEKSGVPVVGTAETEPAGKDYQDWIMSELDAVDRALRKHTP